MSIISQLSWEEEALLEKRNRESGRKEIILNKNYKKIS